MTTHASVSETTFVVNIPDNSIPPQYNSYYNPPSLYVATYPPSPYPQGAVVFNTPPPQPVANQEQWYHQEKQEVHTQLTIEESGISVQVDPNYVSRYNHCVDNWNDLAWERTEENAPAKRYMVGTVLFHKITMMLAFLYCFVSAWVITVDRDNEGDTVCCTERITPGRFLFGCMFSMLRNVLDIPLFVVIAVPYLVVNIYNARVYILNGGYQGLDAKNFFEVAANVIPQNINQIFDVNLSVHVNEETVTGVISKCIAAFQCRVAQGSTKATVKVMAYNWKYATRGHPLKKLTTWITFSIILCICAILSPIRQFVLTIFIGLAILILFCVCCCRGKFED